MLILKQPWSTQPQTVVRPAAFVGGKRVAWAYNAATPYLELVAGRVKAGQGASGDILPRVGAGGMAVYATADGYLRTFPAPITGTEYTVIALVLRNSSTGLSRFIFEQYHSSAPTFFMQITTTEKARFSALAPDSTAWEPLGTSTLSSTVPTVIAGRVLYPSVSVWVNGTKEDDRTATKANSPVVASRNISVGGLAWTNANACVNDIYGCMIIDGAVPDAVLAKMQTPADFWRMFQGRATRIPTAAAAGGGGFKAAWVRPQSRVIGAGVR